MLTDFAEGVNAWGRIAPSRSSRESHDAAPHACRLSRNPPLLRGDSRRPAYDLVLRNGRIVDGTGNPWYRGDVAIRGDTISRIAPSITAEAKRVIDVRGNVIAPGFIDTHTHAARGIFEVPTADNYVRQGVTTVIEGPDGQSRVPLKPLLDQLEATPRSLNVGSFIGHGRERGLEPTMENAADTIIRLVEKGRCRGIFHAIDEGDVVRILAQPATIVASDGEVPIFGRGSPHPRSYGTFARVLGRYVREQRVIGLEDAVRKMTSYPAARIGLADRGVLKAGLKADIAVFDPATVADRATYEEPHQYAVGFSQVIVNGVVVYEGGAMTRSRPGRVHYGPATVR